MPDRGQAVVGWVQGRPVASHELDEYLRELSSTPVADRLGFSPRSAPGANQAAAVRTWALKGLLVERLLSQEAVRLGISGPWSPHNLTDRLQARGELVALQPTEAELLAYYDANLGRYRYAEARRVRHVLVARSEHAEGLARSWPVRPYDLTGFSELARRVSTDDGSRRRGGDIGWVERGNLSGPLEEAIFSCPAGQTRGPVATAFGWHLIAVDAERPAGLQTFEHCRESIRAEMTHDRRWTAWREWLDRRIAEDITVPPPSEHPARPGLPGLAHRH